MVFGEADSGLATALAGVPFYYLFKGRGAASPAAGAGDAEM